MERTTGSLAKVQSPLKQRQKVHYSSRPVPPLVELKRGDWENDPNSPGPSVPSITVDDTGRAPSKPPDRKRI